MFLSEVMEPVKNFPSLESAVTYVKRVSSMAFGGIDLFGSFPIGDAKLQTILESCKFYGARWEAGRIKLGDESRELDRMVGDWIGELDDILKKHPEDSESYKRADMDLRYLHRHISSEEHKAKIRDVLDVSKKRMFVSEHRMAIAIPVLAITAYLAYDYIASFLR